MPASLSSAGRQTLRGVGWMVLTGLLFVAVTAIVRHLGTSMPAIEAAFIRYAVGLLIVLPVLFRLIRRRPKVGMMRLYLVRGLIHGGYIILWFYAMARIPIAEVTALGYLAPIFVAVGAALFLGEQLHFRRIAAVLAGFVGMLVIVRPGFVEISLGQMAMIVGAPFIAASLLLGKRLSRDEDPSMIVAMLSLFVTLTLLPGTILQWRTPTIDEFLLLSLTAAVATAGHYCLTKALQAAPITVTQPISFLQLVWASFVGLALFGEALDPYIFMGGAIIICAATYIAHRESVAARSGSADSS